MRLVALNFEATGLDPMTDQIIQVGAIDIDTKEYLDFNVKLEPGRYLPSKVVESTGITKKDLNTGTLLISAKETIKDFIQDSTVVSHNASFCLGLIRDVISPEFYCTRSMDYILSPYDNHRLADIAKRLMFPDIKTNSAINNAYLTMLLFEHYKKQLGDSGVIIFKNKIVSMVDRYTPPNAIVVK